MVEEPHPIEIAKSSTLTFNEIEPHAMSAEVQLASQRQNAHSRIDHQLAAGWKANKYVRFAVRVARSSNSLLQSGSSDPERRKVNAAAHTVLRVDLNADTHTSLSRPEAYLCSRLDISVW